VIIVCSLEKNKLGENSFNHIESWNQEVEKYCGKIPAVIFTNKVDLVDETYLDLSSIQKIVKKLNFLNYYITSAKTGQGVHEAFNAIIEKLYFKSKALNE
jgi:GTPase SAR1 family protein